MLVQDIMTRQVVAIGPDMPIRDVYALMEQRNIRHFPILAQPPREAAPADPDAAGRRRDIESGRLIGIVSDRDIRLVGSAHPQARPDISLKDPIQRIMVQEVLTAHPLDPIEEAAKILRERKIGAMPVLRDGVLVGIVTAIDFLDALVSMTGVRSKSTRLEVELPNRPGALAGLLTRIAARNYIVSSVMTARSDMDSTCFVLRVDALDGAGLARTLRDDGHQVLWPPDKSALS